MMSQPEPDYEQPDDSIHNDGKGIQFTLEFTPLLPPRKCGERRRKNAKAKASTVVVYINEGADFATFISEIIESVNHLKHSGLGYKMSSQK